VTIGLFEAGETTRQKLVKILKNLLDKYGLRRKKIIVHLKDEVFNLNAMIIILKSLVSYEYIGLEESL
jgi:hypothetical protein